MDNLAHSLVGLAASKAGLERLSPCATAVCILAANVPDIDFVAAFSGDRWTVLHHHRGFSHSIVGVVLLGLIIPVLFCLTERAMVRLRGGELRLKFPGLLVASLVAVATHPLLDWTNSYGVRPLLPWSGRWFYGDLVFVVDPILWIVFGGAAVLLTARSKRQITLWTFLAAVLSLLVVYATFRGRGEHPLLIVTLWFGSLAVIVTCRKLDLGRKLGSKLALSTFVFLLAYWGAQGVLHSRAIASAQSAAQEFAAQRNEQVVRLAATPTLANPSVWRCLVETDRATYRFDVSLLTQNGSISRLVRYQKPDPHLAQIVEAAKADRRTKMFFEFSRFPAERIVGDCATETLVQFADLRYTDPGPTRGGFSLEIPVECPGVSARDGK